MNITHFIEIRKKCSTELRNTKIAYFQKQITQAASKPKTLWQTLKVITGENEKKKQCQYSDFSTRNSHHRI